METDKDKRYKSSHKGRKNKETGAGFNIETSIRKRPNLVKKRVEFSHWELDTVVS